MILKKQLTFRDLCNNILRYSEGEVREEIVQGFGSIFCDSSRVTSYGTVAQLG